MPVTPIPTKRMPRAIVPDGCAASNCSWVACQKSAVMSLAKVVSSDSGDMQGNRTLVADSVQGLRQVRIGQPAAWAGSRFSHGGF